jgi:hypothetical protein
MVMSMKTIAASVVVLGTLGVPAISSAQGYRYGDYDRSSVAVRCAPGQRAVMTQRSSHRGSRVVARCVGSRHINRDRYRRAAYARSTGYDRYDGYNRYDRYDTYRPVARRSQYYDRRPRRSKTKSALMIAGGAATGAGVGGALKGKKGALIGAAIGGGSASIYEAAKRR